MCEFEILSGLPAYGPMAHAFSATGRGKHRVGFVVRFTSHTGSDWVGNFQGGLGGYSGVFNHPNGNDMIIIAGGQGYVVDPNSRQCSMTFGAQIEAAFEVADGKMLVFGNGLWFEAITAAGHAWRRDRISWDGMKNLTVEE